MNDAESNDTDPVVYRDLVVEACKKENDTDAYISGVERVYRDLVVEAYKKGIDRTLLRANLKLTVTERFRRAMEHARFADELRRAGRELRSQHP